jgi:signal transduction histidine kinase
MNKFRRIISWVSQHSLHLRVMLGVVIPLVVVIGAFSIIDYTRRRENTFTTLAMFSSHIGQVIQNDLRHQMLQSDFEGLQQLLITVGQLKEVDAVYLLNTDGEVIFASNESVIGTVMDNEQPECMACHNFEAAERPQQAVVELSGGQQVFRSTQIINNEPICQECHEESSEHLGILLTDLAFAPYQATMMRDIRDHFLWWSLALFLTLGVVGLVFNRFVLLRLNALSRQIAIVGEGQRVTRLPDRPRDEIGRIAAAFNQMAARVEEREADNSELSENLRLQSEQRGQLLNRLISAQENERKRVARDLHDALGQALTALSLRVQSLKRYIGRDEAVASDQIEEIENLISETTETMYDMVLDLRPSVLDDLGLLPALRGHAERVFKPAGIQFVIDVNGKMERLPAEIETVLYRTFQEAINNVCRHADADNVSILFHRSNGIFEGTISDDGRGFDLESVDLSGDSSRGLGILGMRERIYQFGGELEVSTEPGKGTRIQVHLPIDKDKYG